MFQRIIDSIMGDLIGKNVVYLDDIVIFSTNSTEHAEHLQLVFDRLRTAGLRLNPSKCHFELTEVKLLGYIVNAKGIAIDPAKVEAIQDLPPSSSAKQTGTFLGMTSYSRKFVPNYVQVPEPLTQLTKKI